MRPPRQAGCHFSDRAHDLAHHPGVDAGGACASGRLAAGRLQWTALWLSVLPFWPVIFTVAARWRAQRFSLFCNQALVAAVEVEGEL